MEKLVRTYRQGNLWSIVTIFKEKEVKENKKKVGNWSMQYVAAISGEQFLSNM